MRKNKILIKILIMLVINIKKLKNFNITVKNRNYLSFKI
jgi:hypothetical protein